MSIPSRLDGGRGLRVLREQVLLALLTCLGSGCVGFMIHHPHREEAAVDPPETVEALRAAHRALEVRPGDSAGEEFWRSDEEGLGWYGVTLWLGLPLPLVLPLGREYLEYRVVHGRVLSREEVSTHSPFWVFGIVPDTPHGDVRFGALYYLTDRLQSR